MTITHESHSQFAVTWDLALKRYTAAVGRQLDDPSLPHPSSVEELLNRLDSQNGHFSQFRENKRSLFNILTCICNPIERFGSMAASIASNAFPASSVCFSAITYLIDAAKDVSASYNAVIELFFTLKDFLVRLAIYDGSRMSDALQAKVVDILVTLLEIFGQATKLVRAGLRGRIIQFTKNALLGSDKTLQGLVAKLDRLCQTEHQLVGAETLSETKKANVAVENLSAVLNGASLVLEDNHGRLAQAQADLQRLVEGQNDLRQEVHRDISSLLGSFIGSGAKANGDSDYLRTLLQPSLAPSDMYYTFARKRLSGTGEWIEAEVGFRSWLNQEQPLLWINGPPGSGKSFLAEYIISNLKTRFPQGVDQGSEISVGYYFFKDNNPQTRGLHQALRDVAYQICLNDSVYAGHVAARCRAPGDISSLQSAWMTLFRDYFIEGDAGNRRAYIVLDGLDECMEADRQSLLEFLLELTAEESESKSRVQFVMLGRPHLSADVADAFHESVSSISIDRSKNDDDIARYVEHSVRRSRNIARAPSSLRKEVTEFLVKHAQGMFLWVDLMTQELGRHNRASSIRECLQRPPKGLYEAMRRTLEGLSAYLKGDDPEELNTILGWVACASRPLSLREIEATLTLGSSDQDDILDIESLLRLQFASFLALVRDDGLTTSDLQAEVDLSPLQIDDDHDEDVEDFKLENDFSSNPETTEVMFCHASIGDFFRDENENKRSAGPEFVAIGVDIVESRISTLKACLQLVCNSTECPHLRNYALVWWHSHVKAVIPHIHRIGGSDLQEIRSLLLKTLRDESVLEAWISLRDADDFWSLDTLDPIAKLLDDKLFVDSLPLDMRNWVLSSIQEPARLLVPAAECIANKWLQGYRWDARTCMLIIHRIRCLLEGKLDEEFPDAPAASIVLDSAEWAKLPKTAEWNRRVAVCLRDTAHYEEAQAYFEAALELDDQMWLARSGLAYLYSLSGQHEKSLELYKENIEILETAFGNPEKRDKLPHDVEGDDLADTYQSIGEELLSLGDRASALVYLEKALHVTTEGKFLSKYIQLLAEENTPEANEKIIQHLKGLDTASGDNGATRLTECLSENSRLVWSSDFYQAIAFAAKSTDQLEWLEYAYGTAIEVAKKQRNSVVAFALQVSLADLFISYDNKESRALEIWQMVMDFPATFMQGNLLMLYIQSLVSRYYGAYLITKATQAGPGTADAERYIHTLQRIAKRRVVHSDHVSEWAANNFATAILGLWYHRIGQPEKAREYCLPFVKQFVFADDDAISTYTTSYAFAKLLLMMGDESTAVAILISVSSPEEVAWICEARCGVSSSTWEKSNICRECAVDLCDDCVRLVKERKPTRVNICSPDHSWARIPEASAPLGPDDVRVDEVVSIQDVKGKVKKQWGL
ncbi:hypothetical protein CBS115989_1773 [Aspergillus niger]|uniref:NACHT domain-containing protein n=1 Tax=Aspergillus niger ATCC 13496 TaxID=1353008 RepID=A0A370C1W3_ASPNG|nr:uncharacterized protein BO96DRAFT_212727 [Aspergillus niger CBS 101883]KAI2823063.1 hypothetical protein CBS115989_1773 [Aspergillus niger]RDH20355.1 hypothetical protein M747DRAFT_295937 [Aspergillus niger ATCC 13496]KAI2888670.1 hypothetical protein CBS11852_7061 [Aspergillus niger]KAI2949347.1 hypothetical protein CBS147322_5941 [Aspergillus niger]KAI3091402.1 hypothetical protein CBS147343_632 [Aspergillus niger]